MSKIGLLKFIYKDILPSEENILKELLVYSEKILLKGLRFHCERTLIEKVTKENAVELYELSNYLGAEDLREAALRFMGNHLSYFAKQLVAITRENKNKNSLLSDVIA